MTNKRASKILVIAAVLSIFVALAAIIVDKMGKETQTTYNKDKIKVVQTTIFGSVSQCKMVFGTGDAYDTPILTLKTKSPTAVDVLATYKGNTPDFAWLKSDKFGPIASIRKGEDDINVDAFQEIADSDFFILGAKYVYNLSLAEKARLGITNDNSPEVRIDGTHSYDAARAMVDCMSKM